MSFNFSAPLPVGPTTTTPVAKDLQVKAVKLTFADFSTGGTAAVKAVLPADASIVGFRYWKKTQFSGGGVTALSLNIGVPGAATQFANGLDTLTPAAGTNSFIVVVSNIFQDLALPQTSDIQLLFTGTATTGNPTAGEMYVLIEYVR
jgi:hypothetical protein